MCNYDCENCDDYCSMGMGDDEHDSPKDEISYESVSRFISVAQERICLRQERLDLSKRMLDEVVKIRDVLSIVETSDIVDDATIKYLMTIETNRNDYIKILTKDLEIIGF